MPKTERNTFPYSWEFRLRCPRCGRWNPGRYKGEGQRQCFTCELYFLGDGETERESPQDVFSRLVPKILRYGRTLFKRYNVPARERGRNGDAEQDLLVLSWRTFLRGEETGVPFRWGTETRRNAGWVARGYTQGDRYRTRNPLTRRTQKERNVVVVGDAVLQYLTGRGKDNARENAVVSLDYFGEFLGMLQERERETFLLRSRGEFPVNSTRNAKRLRNVRRRLREFIAEKMQ